MRIRVPSADGFDPGDCPHQFVGRCDACAAAPARQLESFEPRDRPQLDAQSFEFHAEPPQ